MGIFSDDICYPRLYQADQSSSGGHCIFVLHVYLPTRLTIIYAITSGPGSNRLFCSPTFY